MYFSDMFESQYLSHTYNTRNRDVAILPQPNKKSSLKCIRYQIPEYLQRTPDNVTEKFDTHSRSGFINYSKMHFLNSYVFECTDVNCYACKTS